MVMAAVGKYGPESEDWRLRYSPAVCHSGLRSRPFVPFENKRPAQILRFASARIFKRRMALSTGQCKAVTTGIKRPAVTSWLEVERTRAWRR